jgi:formyltetrahydrofolate deformylase
MSCRPSLKLARSKFASLRLHGPDQKGIVAAYSQILDKYGCAIMKSEQLTDPGSNHFYQRSLFYPSKFTESDGNNITDYGFHAEEKLAIQDEMDQLKAGFGLNMMEINWRERPKRMAVFVSKYGHCLVSGWKTNGLL